MAGVDPHPPRPPQEDVEKLILPSSFPKLQSIIQPLTCSYADILVNKNPSSSKASYFKPFSVDCTTKLKGNIQTQAQFAFGSINQTNVYSGILADTHGAVTKSIQDYKLKPKSTHQGKPSVVFHKEDKQSLINNLPYVLVGKFSHGRPSFNSVQNFVAKLHLKETVSISIYDSKHLFLECRHFHDFVTLWMKNVWSIDGYHMRMFKWSEFFHPSKESSTSPVWIHLPGLPLYLFDELSLLSLGNVIGKPLKVDIANITRSRLGCASICVELDVSSATIDSFWVDFVDDKEVGKGEGFWQKVLYGYMPSYCSGCAHLGHKVATCKREQVGLLSVGTLDYQNKVSPGVSITGMGEVEKENEHGFRMHESKESGTKPEIGPISVGQGSNDVQEDGNEKGTFQLQGMLVNKFGAVTNEVESLLLMGTPLQVNNTVSGQNLIHHAEGSTADGEHDVGEFPAAGGHAVQEPESAAVHVIGEAVAVQATAVAAPAVGDKENTDSAVSRAPVRSKMMGKHMAGTAIPTLHRGTSCNISATQEEEELFEHVTLEEGEIDEKDELGSVAGNAESAVNATEVVIAGNAESAHEVVRVGSAGSVDNSSRQKGDAVAAISLLSSPMAAVSVAADPNDSVSAVVNEGQGAISLTQEDCCRDGVDLQCWNCAAAAGPPTQLWAATTVDEAAVLGEHISKDSRDSHSTQFAGLLGTVEGLGLDTNCSKESSTEPVTGAAVSDANEGVATDVGDAEQKQTGHSGPEFTKADYCPEFVEKTGTVLVEKQGTVLVEVGADSWAKTKNAGVLTNARAGNSWADLVEDEKQAKQGHAEAFQELNKNSLATLEEEVLVEESPVQLRIISQITLSEVEAFAKKEIEKIWPPKISDEQVFNTSLPFIPNPYMLDKEGNAVLISEVIEKSARVSELSEQITKKRNPDYDQSGENAIVALKELGLYDKMVRCFTIEIVEALKEHRQTSFYKDSTTDKDIPLNQKVIKNGQAPDEQEWTTPKRRGRLPNKIK